MLTMLLLPMLLLAMMLPESNGKPHPATVEVYGSPTGCQNCTCVHCPCVKKNPQCGKCGAGSLVAKIKVVPDGVCHETKVVNAHPFVSSSALAPLKYMAVVCKAGLWLGADGATRSECESRGAGLVSLFERGELDAKTSVCLPEGQGAFIQFMCPDDDITGTVFTPTPPQSVGGAFTGYLTEFRTQRTWLQYAVTEVSDAIPLVVPVCLFVLYVLRKNLPDLGKRKFRVLGAVVAAVLLVVMLLGSVYSY
eukprot:TRINITY_DN1148_c3_g1_i1.p1 TRINITY_DN1148_c3_g1~~TRINITY_DN1148_c3_g1_i1.p1  ORF type:complete len:250 (+),score=23.83 TRINITY_DN1148_c3_g1_i1:57-806(+)